MKIKSAFTLLSTGIIVGFFVGFGVSLHKIVINNYMVYKLLKLVGYTFQNSLNRWTIIGSIASIGIIIIYIFFQFIIKSFSKSEGIRCFSYIQAIYKFFTIKYLNIIAILFILSLFILNFYMELSSRNLNRPNIILISIDTLRADHLGCYGYERNTSPNIDSFAKNNILFEKCYTPEPWTATAHLSMLTSLYPITHGVDATNYPLHPAFITLAEVLKNEGYFTMGFANNIFVSPECGVSQGFDYYIFKKNYCSWEPNRNAEHQNIFIKNYLHKHRKKKFFLFIHYFDVHSDFGELPYEAPPPYDKLFSADYDGNLDGRLKGKSASKYLANLKKKRIKLNERDIQYIISLYDNGIAYMDKCIGELFKILQEMNVFDNSLIIITADHGEGFQEEHGYMLHGYPYYYEEQMHVPLIVKPPKENSDLKTGGKRIESLVEIIDIMPSILDYLHINISNIKLQGKSFLRLLNYDANKRNYIFGFGSDALGRGPKDNLMVRSKRWKLISDGGLKEERFKLFDLENDTKEQKNLVKKRLDIKTELVGKLIEKIEESKKLRMGIFRKHQDNSCEELFSEVKKEELEALGYIE